MYMSLQLAYKVVYIENIYPYVSYGSLSKNDQVSLITRRKNPMSVCTH